MGTRGREIVGMDVNELSRLLNQAYASEWLAYYQYWLGAKLIKGPMKDAVAAELNLHANEELAHAVLLAGRIIQLGGTPVTHPKDWMPTSPCKYDAPDDPYVAVLLDQNIAGEQCAISTYKALMDKTRDKDMVTYQMALTILQQEVEHEEDLQSLKEDLELMVKRGSR
jgi:bacterioferritin